MNLTFVKSIPFTPCKSVFLSKLVDVGLLPQCNELDAFVAKHNIENISQLIVNHHYCSLEELAQRIVNVGNSTRQYLYLAINKFYIYSTVDTHKSSSLNNYDFKLIEFCCHALSDQYALLTYTTRSDDHGTLGNFVHPVTTMFFKKHA